MDELEQALTDMGFTRITPNMYERTGYRIRLSYGPPTQLEVDHVDRTNLDGPCYQSTSTVLSMTFDPNRETRLAVNLIRTNVR